MRYSTLLLLLPALFFFGSCAKKEQAVTLPARGSATHAEVDMGGDYKTQIFYNLADSSIVSTSDHTIWDVAFEAGAGQGHLFLNGSLGYTCYGLPILLLLPCAACLPAPLMPAGCMMLPVGCRIPVQRVIGRMAVLHPATFLFFALAAFRLTSIKSCAFYRWMIRSILLSMAP